MTIRKCVDRKDVERVLLSSISGYFSHSGISVYLLILKTKTNPIFEMLFFYTRWAKSRYTVYSIYIYYCIPNFGPPCIKKSTSKTI